MAVRVGDCLGLEHGVTCAAPDVKARAQELFDRNQEKRRQLDEVCGTSVIVYACVCGCGCGCVWLRVAVWQCVAECVWLSHLPQLAYRRERRPSTLWVRRP